MNKYLFKFVDGPYKGLQVEVDLDEETDKLAKAGLLNVPFGNVRQASGGGYYQWETETDRVVSCTYREA